MRTEENIQRQNQATTRLKAGVDGRSSTAPDVALNVSAGSCILPSRIGRGPIEDTTWAL